MEIGIIQVVQVSCVEGSPSRDWKHHDHLVAEVRLMYQKVVVVVVVMVTGYT